MSAATALARGRRMAESMMTTGVVVTRATTGEPDAITGQRPRVQVYPAPDWPASHAHADGKAKLQSFEGYESNPVTGQKVSTVQRMSLHFPVGSFRMKVGDQAEVVASTDSLLIGRKLRLAQIAPFKENATSYRVFVEEVTG